MATKMEEWADEYAAKQESTMDLAGEKFVTVCRDTAMELVKLRPLVQRPPKNSRSRQQYWCHGDICGRTRSVEDGTQVTTGLERSNVQEYLAVMSQMADRLVKKWEDQCDETTTTTATGIVRNIQVDLGNITADCFQHVGSRF
jgi:hypothetical protein